MSNSTIIDKTVEITVAKMSSSDVSANELTGKDIANFMQVIYDKLSEFNSKDH